MKLNLLKLALALFTLMPSYAIAQKGSVRGSVLDGSNGEPIIFTNVMLKGTTIGATTDINGFFSITNIPTGQYILTCTNVGFDTANITINIVGNQILNQKITLNRVSVQLRDIQVNARREEKTTETLISITKITPKDIQKIPGVGGEADIAQYLQVIPGIVSTGDQGGELFIRGGAPIETKVLIDGMTIYNPFHSIGLFSVFETDIIRSANVLTGGFNSEYGGRLSAMVDITTRDGNKKRFGGKISTNPFLSKLTLEGPLKRLDSKGSSISYILNGKTSYLDKSSKVFYSYIDSAGLPYAFNDLYGKLSFNSSTGSKFNLFGFRFTDRVNYQHVSNFKWNTYGIGSNFVLVPSGSNLLLSGYVSYSNYKIELSEADGKPRTSGINGFDLGMNVTYFLPKNSEVKYGFSIGGFRTDFQFTNPLGLNTEESQNTTELSGFILWKKVAGKFVIEPSFRAQYYASLPAFSPEPRLAMKYNATDALRFKLAGGVYSQNFISTKSDKDIVDLFTGFLSSPDQELKTLDGTVAPTNLQRAYHAVFGIETDFSKSIEMNVEPYYKLYDQLINLNRFKVLPTDPNYQIETGKAYGIDFILKYDNKNLFVSTGYSFAFVKRDNGQQVYTPYFDRRHNANLLISYSFGRNKSWQADLRWNLGSGFPFTQTQGFFEYYSFLRDGINTDYTTANGDLGIIYDSTLNGGRLPYFHRLDVSVKKTIAISKNSKLDINASIINVYSRENIFYFDRVRYKRVNQLPILPSMGLSLTF